MPVRRGWIHSGALKIKPLGSSKNMVLTIWVDSLMKLLRAERKRMLSLHSLGLTPAQAIDIISFAAPRSGPGSGPSELEGYFDASDRKEGGDVIVWFNDIEKDSRYARWGRSLTGVRLPSSLPSLLVPGSSVC